ncbi:sigma-70 family RNA polymerase sigma factor [Maricaulis sp.]|jgi:RNA polymerase sigma-70 factor (ECF subfamily)|uniref:sigma-70 family RNA polymerase sigma factor n=1 Tax=Maricaulis sp. TaxID=1486257 RepID=UPI002614DABE|nr:sigma-70 family RNA polymerase sigma factor [Maricaulis sp.]
MADDPSRCELDESEFKRLLHDAIPHMRAFARGLTGDATAADDLAQDALLRAWHRRHQFRANTNFKAWVLTIVRNQFYSDKRRSWRQVQLDEETARETLPATVDQDGVLALDEVRRALAELSPEHREALMLVGAGGYAYQEAADICGCAVGTMKSRVNRARARLMEVLDAGPALGRGGDGVSASDALDTLLTELEQISECRSVG